MFWAWGAAQVMSWTAQLMLGNGGPQGQGKALPRFWAMGRITQALITVFFMEIPSSWWLSPDYMSKSKESSRLGRRAPSNLIGRNYRHLGFVPPKGHVLESPTQRHLPTLCIAFRVCRGESWALFGCRWYSTSRDEGGLATAISTGLCQLLQDVLFKSYYCFYLVTSGV